MALTLEKGGGGPSRNINDGEVRMRLNRYNPQKVP